MVDLVDNHLKGHGSLPGGMAPIEALRRLRFSVARTSTNAAMYEADLELAIAMFRAAYDFSGSQHHRVLSVLGRRLPLTVLGLMARTKGAPRGSSSETLASNASGALARTYNTGLAF